MDGLATPIESKTSSHVSIGLQRLAERSGGRRRPEYVYSGPVVACPNQYHPNLIQIRPQWQMDNNRIAECVTWWQGSVGTNYGLSQLTAAGTAMNVSLGPGWAPLGSPLASYIGCIVTDWTTSLGQITTVAVADPGTGTGSLGNNTAALISLKQGARYKGGKGRVYLPCLGTSVTTDGQNLTSAAHTQLNTIWTQVWGQMNTVTSANGGPYFQFIYRQRTKGSPVGPCPPFMAAFASQALNFTAQTMMATQRRRLRKVAHK